MPREIHSTVETCGLDCAVCGHEQVVLRDERTAVCPACDESYSLVVRDEFTLLESNGWTTRVTFDFLDDVPGVVTG